MSVTSIKGLFVPVLIAGLALSGCATSQPAQPMAREPHRMMQALGCAHAPMDMASMKTMSPEQHKAMMAKHLADCREKLMSEGRTEAMAQVRACLTRAVADASKGGKRIAVASTDAAVQSCTQSMAVGPSASPAAPAHSH